MPEMAAGVAETLGWDSQFFGVSIARALPSRLDAGRCRELLAWCAARHVDCLYFLAAIDHPPTLRVLEEAQFALVDVRMTLVREIPDGARSGGPSDPQSRSGEPSDPQSRTGRPFLGAEAATAAKAARPQTPNGEPPLGADAHPPVRLRDARDPDIPALRAIAATAHRDTRFYADGRFATSRCDELYATWIENSCRGYADHVIVAERDGRIAGYLTLHVERPHSARIGLMGVGDVFRRQGIGRRLLHDAFQRLAREGIHRLSVVTPGRNVAAQAMYQSAGFRTAAVALWYHRWFA